MKKFYIFLSSAMLLTISLAAQSNLISFGSTWNYLDNGSNQGTNWRGISFNDGGWKTGNGKFGYGITDAATNISYGNSPGKKYITTYFRKNISIADPTAYTSFTGAVKRDDGVAIYVNGAEVYRNNLPAGTLSYTTLASRASDDGYTAQSFNISASAFVSGTNTIAVEIHQEKANTPDMAFDLSLTGNSNVIAPSVVSINRQSPTTINTTATSVTYRVTFSEKVTGVDALDFTPTRASGTVSGNIASNGVVTVGTNGDTYDVTVSSITGTGDLRLDLNTTGTGIANASGNAIDGGYTSGQTYTIQAADVTAPTISSINRQSPITITTTATSVTYRVTFSEKVTGVDALDFTPTRVSGTVSGSIASNGVVTTGTNGDTYDVTVSSITGTGDLRLDLNTTGTGIIDASGNAISGGYTSGQTYTIQAAANNPPNSPTNPSPANGDFTSPSSTSLCANVSDPDNNLLRVRFYGRRKVSSGKFTIVMLPDTQYYTAEPQGTNGGNNSMFKSQTAWIANNRSAKNIVYVGQLGDCAEHGDTYQVEWKRADTAMKTIESPTLTGLTGGIPYGVCVGNHDQSPNGSATGTTTFFNQYFGTSRFSGRPYYGGHNGTNNDNFYQLFSAGGIDFLIICPEYDQSTAFSAVGGTLDWVEDLVKSYPKRKVIIMTHLVVNGDGTFSAQGQSLYNRLKVYPNLILMFGGHISLNTGEVRRSDTYNNNTIQSVVSDYQSRTNGGNGLLRIYEFDPLNNNVSVQTYSPYTNTYETDANSQFNLPVNLSSGIVTSSYSLIGEVSNVASGNNACVSWPSLEQNADYEWYAEVFDGVSTTTGPVWSFTTKSGAQRVSNLIRPSEPEPLAADQLFTLFPNPDYIHNLTLMFNNRLKKEVLVEVMDVSGRLQIKREFKNVGATISLKHRLAAGTYIIKVQEGQNQETKKIIVAQ